MRHTFLWLSASLFLGIFSTQGNAIVTWPSDSDWNPLMACGGIYTDLPEDVNPNDVDVVGNIVGVNDHPAGFWYLGASDLALRMRIADSGAGSNRVWMFIMDTADVDNANGHNLMDLSLQLDQDIDERLELVLTDNGGPSWTGSNADRVSVSAAADDVLWTGDKATYTRWVVINDYTIPGNNPVTTNYYLDVAIPWATLTTLANAEGKPINSVSDIRIALCSSATHSGVVNKDHPDCATVSDYLSDPLVEPTVFETVPEPSSLLGLVMGVTSGLGMLLRRKSR